jgi:hypothetical protein
LTLHPLAILAAAALLVGCDGEERRDAESLVAAVGRFRAADLSSTPAMVDALRATPCRAAEVCAAKDTCLVAGDALSRSLTLKAEVAKGLSAVEKGTLPRDSAEAKAMPAKLDEAEVLLKKGYDGLPACDDQVRALKRKHRI